MRVLLLISLLINSLHAKDPQLEGPGLAINLIADSRTIVTGKPLTVGLTIQHFPGFHTYWKSPGQVGVGTAIEWTLPEGFTASEIAWPYPENSFMGQYPCHGYDRDVTLLTTIHPPADFDEKTVTLSAKTTWMCCAKGCFPGFETFTLTLPVSDTQIPDPAAIKLIKKARSELPESKHKLTTTLLSKMDASEIKLNIKGPESLSSKGAYFFSSDGQISSDQKQIFVPEEDGSITLTIPRSEFSPEKRPSLPGVLRVGEKHFAINAKPKG